MTSEQKVRFRKKSGFTVIQNYAVDDKSLSMKALGLYCRIQRWITYEAEDFECTKAFIQSRSTEGAKAFDSAWSELKEKGYLKMYCYPAPRTFWEAELLDEPQPDTPHTYYLDSNGKVKSNNEDRERKRQAKLKVISSDQETASCTLSDPVEICQTEAQNGEKYHYPKKGVMVSDTDHYPQNGCNGNGYNGNQRNGNGGNNINTPYNTINNPNDHLSINQEQNAENDSLLAGSPLMDKMDLQSAYEKVYAQVDYNAIVHDMTIGNAPDQKDVLHTVVTLIAEINLLERGTVRINGLPIPCRDVQQRYSRLTRDHIDYILMCLRKSTTQIRNIRSYLITALYNAPETMDTYYAAMVASTT